MRLLEPQFLICQVTASTGVDQVTRNGYEAATSFRGHLINCLHSAVNVAISLSYVLHFFEGFANTQEVQRKYSGSTHIFPFSISDTTQTLTPITIFSSFRLSFLSIFMDTHWGETQESTVQSFALLNIHGAFVPAPSPPSDTKMQRCSRPRTVTQYGRSSVSLDSASANRKDCASLRGDSIGNRRWHRLHGPWVGWEPCCLRLALSTVLLNVPIQGRCLSEVGGGPGADAEQVTQSLLV